MINYSSSSRETNTGVAKLDGLTFDGGPAFYQKLSKGENRLQEVEKR